MSTARQVPASTSTVERRFYSRVAPRAPIYLALNKNQALLLNVSENGLLISTPAVLGRNFVARVSLPLNGLAQPVQVNVRVVWTNEARKQAGIQLLDLSDYDREQIRKWGTQESVPQGQVEPQRPRVVAAPPARSYQAAEAEPPLAAPPLSNPWDLPPLPNPVVIRTRSTSALAGIVMWGVLAALVCSAGAFFLKHGAPTSLFTRSTQNLPESAATPPQETSDTPQNPDTQEPGTDGDHSSLARSQDSAKPETTLTRPSTTRSSAQTVDEDGLDAASETADPQSSVLDTPPARRDIFPASSIPSSKPTDTSRPATQTQLDPPSDPVLSRAAPTVTTEGAFKPSSDSASLPAPITSTPDAAPPLPKPPPATKQSISNSLRANEVFPNASTMIASSPIVASTRPAALRRSDVSVIQMDAPGGQVMEIHPPSRYHSSFFNLPGERVLESPSITIHIQRSVRMPPAHAWWPFNRNKKIVVGELVARVDPQGAPVQIGDSVRVNATVAEDGHVSNVRPINGPANLVPSVVRAVHEWRYQPTLMDDKPVETECYVVVQFHAPSNRPARP
jgi:hypothetical protein